MTQKMASKVEIQGTLLLLLCLALQDIALAQSQEIEKAQK
jgi:hypothetical protein